VVSVRRRKREDLIARFLADFPDEATAVGGPAGLRDAASVRARMSELAAGKD
jgi:hypothetical protein